MNLCLLTENAQVTIQTGLRIYCADRTKTYRKEASGPSRSDWNGRMPLLFCRRLNSNTPCAGRSANLRCRSPAAQQSAPSAVWKKRAS